MDYSSAMIPQTDMQKEEENEVPFLDSKLASKFIWPAEDVVSTQEELNEPLIDLSGFMSGDEAATARAVELVRKACLNHGFFQVTNHGIDSNLIHAAYEEIDTVFKLPVSLKRSAWRNRGQVTGYSGAHADRYSSKLPWKETFSFIFRYDKNDSDPQIVKYFKSTLGEDLENSGRVYQKYCEAMKELSLVIMELLAISLGVDRLYFPKFFEDGSAIMRCNYSPPCNTSNLTLGTGPHSDPNSITIIHQDQVGGLQVFSDNKWLALRPRPNALVVNLGDTFMALTNGIYKSCLHRALVHKDKGRRSLIFFVNSKADKTVKPPKNLFDGELKARRYPDFTWSDLFEFVQNYYRPDFSTFESFIEWRFRSSKPSTF